MFLNAATRVRFQEYVRGPQWVSKTMIIAQRGCHFPQCCYTKSFSKVHASPWAIFKNNDYSWEGLTFSSMPLCEIVFKSTCEALNESQKQWLRGVGISPNAATRNRFQKCMQAPESFSKTMIIAERGWHFPQCRCVKLFSNVHVAPQWFSKAMSIAERGWYFPPCR